MQLRASRRDRAARNGPSLFLYQRSFDDIIERVEDVRLAFQSALLIGSPDPRWPTRLAAVAGRVAIADPGPLFAAAAGGQVVVEDQASFGDQAHDLVVAVGTLDTVNGLPQALRSIRSAMRPGSLFIGAMSGGDTLPLLRSAMRSADQSSGVASAHVHPRIEPAALGALLAAAGFVDCVVDVDRVRVAYSRFGDLVADLRAMGAGNILTARSRSPLARSAFHAAEASFAAAAIDGRTTELFEVLHFAAWTPPAPLVPASKLAN